MELKDNTLKVSQLLQHYMHNIYRQVLEDTLVDVPQRRNNVQDENKIILLYLAFSYHVLCFQLPCSILMFC